MNKTLLILKKELREVFRDKKSLAMMLIIPVLIPLIIIGMSALFESETIIIKLVLIMNLVKQKLKYWIH